MTAGAAGVPRRDSRIARALANRRLALTGWRVEGVLPACPRFIIIVATHTSNWDFPLGLLTMFALDLRASWLGKHTLFRFPTGLILRWIGGEPVDRSATHGTVDAAIEHFHTRPQWVLARSTEGTRRREERWNTGFLRIAAGASVPIMPVWIDYSTPAIGIGPPVPPSGDAPTDLATLRGMFRKEMAKFPERFTE